VSSIPFKSTKCTIAIYTYSLAGTLVLMVLLFVYIKSNPASRLLKRKVAATIPLWDEEKRVCYKEVNRNDLTNDFLNTHTKKIDSSFKKAVKRNCENQVFLPAGHKIAILNLEQNEGSLRKRSYDKPSVRRESQRRASIE